MTYVMMYCYAMVAIMVANVVACVCALVMRRMRTRTSVYCTVVNVPVRGGVRYHNPLPVEEYEDKWACLEDGVDHEAEIAFFVEEAMYQDDIRHDRWAEYMWAAMEDVEDDPYQDLPLREAMKRKARVQHDPEMDAIDIHWFTGPPAQKPRAKK